ncbi:unnamed protein product [Triticum turgidum subsp. durum]|uniref:Uncharacterized protein n=1 Tax=Triticum turgidum subsp. durum TaxID=4567 RepID=A0A9R0WP58_TRITD|nr:unnamed protein product [Triticum turgidum subsp. durum]
MREQADGNNNITIMLVGNKSDLGQRRAVRQGERPRLHGDLGQDPAQRGGGIPSELVHGVREDPGRRHRSLQGGGVTPGVDEVCNLDRDTLPSGAYGCCSS